MSAMYLLAAIAIGISFSAQPAINGAAANVLGSPVSAAAISVAITLSCTLALLPWLAGRTPFTHFSQLPWWVVLGGVIGVLIVAGGAAIAPVTGVTLFFVCMIAGQLMGSLLLDHLGAFGLSAQPISLTKCAGVALALIGVLLVRSG
ncbi:MAG: DMT family transporter [Pseudomonadota bacterium]